ncbi:uncharacterized protein LOC141907848 [Tubulanus polymorphus]|uniref:uncharacterized protein LOC141907848 n=1 Tax=Tubulanus polymorphus TaxID=672921 RepID=UPI003DA4D33D
MNGLKLFAVFVVVLVCLDVFMNVEAKKGKKKGGKANDKKGKKQANRKEVEQTVPEEEQVVEGVAAELEKFEEQQGAEMNPEQEIKHLKEEVNAVKESLKNQVDNLGDIVNEE